MQKTYFLITRQKQKKKNLGLAFFEDFSSFP